MNGDEVRESCHSHNYVFVYDWSLDQLYPYPMQSAGAGGVCGTVDNIIKLQQQ